MAHCVWSDERERQAMKDAGVTVVHCADSNQNLCSGVAPVRVMLNEGLKVALGSDIAGGDHLDMFDVVTSAIRASKARRMMDDWQTPFLTVAEGWYLGTSAGAALFRGEAGFAAGNPLHAMVLGGQRPAPAPAPDPGRSSWNGRCTAVRRGPYRQSGPPEEKSTRSRKKVVRKSLEHKQRSRVFGRISQKRLRCFAFLCGRGVFHWFRWNYCTVTGLGYTPRKSNQPRGSRMAPR